MAPVVKGQLSESEKKLMAAILNGTTQEIGSLLKEPDVRVDCLDQTGMTPLHHAAFKGRADVCRLLMEMGADVNSNEHENDYSTLHFAALSGNVEVTNLMLEAGAKTDRVNSVNRTASQMAGFVGQHQCVRAINNFFPKDRLEKYTVPRGFDKEPKLPPALLMSLLKLINSSNLHPVKVALYLKDNRQLVLESYKVCKVLDLIVEDNMKSRETNDVQALKCHYFAAIIRLANKSLKNSEDNLDTFLKSLVKGRDSDGFSEKQDRIIRQALKDFPHPESQLLQQLVRHIAPVKIGEGSPALSMLTSAMYGPSFEDDTACTTCGEPKADKLCSACKYANYCNQTCQKLHWSTHKKLCASQAELKRKLDKQREEEERQEHERKEMQEKMNQVKLAEKSSSGDQETGTGDNAPTVHSACPVSNGAEEKQEQA